MGLTLEELAARTDLVDKVAAHHIIPRARATAATLRGAAASSPAVPAAATAAAAAKAAAAKGPAPAAAAAAKPAAAAKGPASPGVPATGIYAISGDPHYVLRFSSDAAGRVTVQDPQGREAHVVGADIDAGRSVVHAIDAVLLSGEYFPDFTAFIRFYGANFTHMAAALKAVGGASKNWTGTLFAPTNAGFAAAAKVRPELRPARLAAAAPADVAFIKTAAAYLQLPAVRVYPGGFVSNQSVATKLKGHNLTVALTRTNTTTARNATRTVLEGAVLSEPGSPGAPAPIVLPNVYVTRGVLHIVDGFPLPAPGAAAAPAAAAAAAASAGAAPATTGTPAPGGRRRLLRGPGGGAAAFHGAGPVRPAGGGYAGGGGGRPFDGRTAARTDGTADPSVSTTTSSTTTNNYYGRGNGYAASALAYDAGMAAGASAAPAYGGDYEGEPPPPQSNDYEDATASAPPSETGPSAGVPPLPPAPVELPPPPAAAPPQQYYPAGAPPQQGGCINCYAYASAPAPPPAPVQLGPPTTPPNPFEAANGQP